MQVIDEVDEREEAKQTLMEVDSASVEEVKAEEPVTNEVKAGMTSQERVQKLAALRAKMVSYHQPCLSADYFDC